MAPQSHAAMAKTAFDGIELDELNGFRQFIVGGAVRDAALRDDPTDIDMMAVPEPSSGIDDPVKALSDAGLTAIDPSDAFPVFVDSHGHEVALPRRETRSATQGTNPYKAFDVSIVSPDTPVREAVETDLERRDLTINAMAFDVSTDKVLAPHGGLQDLDEGILRHVSNAFAEDPIRVLRLARFAARFPAFSIHSKTTTLSKAVASDLSEVPGERIAIELRKTFKQSDMSGMAFDVLKSTDAMDVAFPEIPINKHDMLVRRLTEAKTVGEKFVVLGDVIGSSSNELLVSRLALSNAEKKAMHSTEHFDHFIAAPTADATQQRKALCSAIEFIESIDGSSSKATAKDVLHAVVHTSTTLDEQLGHKRLQAAREAIENVRAPQVMDELDIHERDIGDAISGDEFRSVLRARRVSEIMVS